MALNEEKLLRRIDEIGREFYESARRRQASFLSRDHWDAALLEWSMKDPDLKVRIFRFVDVLPVLQDPEDLVEHLRRYFGDTDRGLPVLGQWGIQLAGGNRLVARAAAAAIRRNVERMARRFIAGTASGELLDVVRRLRRQGMAFTAELLGEATVSEAEADERLQGYLGMIDTLCEEADGWEEIPAIDRAGAGSIPRVNVSIKLSALDSQFDSVDPDGSIEAVSRRLRPILRRAREKGAFVNFDMEHYAIKDLTLETFFRVLTEDEFADWSDAGIALQAYLRDTPSDLERVIRWCSRRKCPVTVRLVRGAYWDMETVLARQRGWPIPVFTKKYDTDIRFEECVRRLLKSHPVVRTAVASHNIRSLAVTSALAEAMSVPADAYEFQMLYGMGDPLKEAVVERGVRLRIYTPYGELIPGMAYLVRRLLENTANESFLRRGFVENAPVEELLEDPRRIRAATEIEPAAPPRTAKRPAGGTPPFVNTPERDFSSAPQRAAFAEALREVRRRLGGMHPLFVGGEECGDGRDFVSANPSRLSEEIGRAACATVSDADRAVDAARRAFPEWRDTPPSRRAHLLFRTAELLRERRDEMAAWEVLEVGKNWREADADVVEAIDYLEYYGREMLRLSGWRPTQDLPGETNEYGYQPRGVAVVIPPWNFPLAIPVGMTSAALAAGNTVVLKPASQSPIVAARMIRIFRDAGIPAGVLNFLPGHGSEIGDHLVKHPAVHLIAFTGSRDVGCRILRLAAEISPGQAHVKRVITEMGGKNAVIIDSDADLDEAVRGVVVSAFGFQGQKCSAASRVIVLEKIYEPFLARLVEAARSLRQGPSENPGNFMGPVVSPAAKRRILDYIEVGKQEAEVALEIDASSMSEGSFVGPAIFRDVDPGARIAREEIFGPVLAVLPARDLDHALEIALGVDYCLTGGLYSRNPASIRKIRREFRVGNLYINRKITGAVVERQPFGGFGMSGIGSKAGGPDYLIQFLEPRTITENTMRRGFAPEEPGEG